LAVAFDFVQRRDRFGSGWHSCFPGGRRDRLAMLKDALLRLRSKAPATLLTDLHIHLYVRDARQSGFEPVTAEFLYSNGVLEYMYRLVLDGIFSEFRPLARPGVTMIDRLLFRAAFRF
jgi:hypothetical protein